MLRIYATIFCLIYCCSLVGVEDYNSIIIPLSKVVIINGLKLKVAKSKGGIRGPIISHDGMSCLDLYSMKHIADPLREYPYYSTHGIALHNNKIITAFTMVSQKHVRICVDVIDYNVDKKGRINFGDGSWFQWFTNNQRVVLDSVAINEPKNSLLCIGTTNGRRRSTNWLSFARISQDIQKASQEIKLPRQRVIVTIKHKIKIKEKETVEIDVLN